MAEEEIPARFRKTKTGKWAVMAPVPTLEKALAEGGKVDVQKKSGDWSTFVVASLGRPFDVDGVEMCYGYGPEEDDDGAGSGSGGNTGSADSSRPPAAAAARSPRRNSAAPPPVDPSEPLPEFRGGPEDEWDNGF